MDEKNFLDAIAAEPAANLPRLAYADWLDEHDKPTLAHAYRWAVSNKRHPSWRKNHPHWWRDEPPNGYFLWLRGGVSHIGGMSGRLPKELYEALGHYRASCPFESSQEAYIALANALEKLRVVYCVPRETPVLI